MDVAPTVAEQLRVLSSSPDAWADAAAWAWGRQHPGPAGDAEGAAGPADGELTARWGRLSREVVAVVPSCVAVSIAVSRLGIDVVITAPTAAPEPMPRVLQVYSSLALSLPAAGSGCLLVLQASAPGAFVLLAEQLAVLLGSGHQPPELDAHLAPVATSTGSALAEALADLSLLDRALGLLIDHGWPPEAGERELHRRASASGLTVTGVAERMLTPSSPAVPDGLD
ncbi:MAG: hypothetical protein JWO98_4589 [Frankiales bacterium]|nr:hypothetical protein [Frankiales bacterium]